MNKKERAQQVFVEVLAQRGGEGMYAFDLLAAAQRVPVEPTRLHRFGNKLLEVTGRQPRQYTGRYSFLLYPTLIRLEQAGVVESDWEDPIGEYPPRRVYRLTQSGQESPS